MVRRSSAAGAGFKRHDTGSKPGGWHYAGPSMAPTLKSGDILAVEGCGDREIRRGDVILFDPAGDGKHVIHRVVSAGALIRTRGDNNSQVDPWVLLPQDVVGRVTHARGPRGTRRIAGGLPGHLRASAVHLLRAGLALLEAPFRPLYRRLAAAGTLRRLVSLDRRVRVIALVREGRSEHKLLWRDRVIGRCTAPAGRWRIRRPYRLFLDEAALPRP
ncbi:MAG: signal peptidase I [Deltaproteobacteria bacterium]|nr:signal peptidase I [Deltaproteobacteria bacterium]